MNVERVVLNRLQPLFRNRDSEAWRHPLSAEWKGQEANDFLRAELIKGAKPLMVSKFGTVELNNFCAYRAATDKEERWKNRGRFLRGYLSLYPKDSFQALCSNAGFFPRDTSLMGRWAELLERDMAEIDVLASYCRQEMFIEKLLEHPKRVDLEGFYAPFMWNNPWTMALKGKRVLVVHPFARSIEQQYERRELLFEDANVLPSFADLKVIKAVQSIGGNGDSTGYENWFEALEGMKNEISGCRYDVALIGCGAYGMHLAAHVKREGKVALHLGSWVQMLFGIYGNRWLRDQPRYARFINAHWIRPSEEERPPSAESIEGGCYW